MCKPRLLFPEETTTRVLTDAERAEIWMRFIESKKGREMYSKMSRESQEMTDRLETITNDFSGMDDIIGCAPPACG